MNLPYSWLNEFLTLPDVPTLKDLLIDLGLSVEAVHELNGAPDKVIIADIVDLKNVEASDHLKLATLSDGQNSYQVLTGAPNAKLGMRTALATLGAELATGITISKRNMMGFDSEAVVCSPKELGLYDYGAGLIEFGQDAPLGAALAPLWPAETVIELSLTPNRSDALSLLGVARDLAAKLNVPCHHPATGLDLGDKALDTGLKLILEDKDCKRFSLRRIDGVKVVPSPIWLQRRLAALGLRPRNNLVDITNYVTYELGQPSHAYDLNDLIDGTIIVRSAKEGEQLTALDEKTYSFNR
ncbi:MAG: phenylalanine--tRNA ligase beta subunit-related protein [Deinococcales bacterium]